MFEGHRAIQQSNIQVDIFKLGWIIFLVHYTVRRCKWQDHLALHYKYNTATQGSQHIIRVPWQYRFHCKVLLIIRAHAILNKEYNPE